MKTFKSPLARSGLWLSLAWAAGCGCGSQQDTGADAAQPAQAEYVPEVLFERQGGSARALAADGSYVYWSENTWTDSAIFRTPRDGGEVQRLGPSRSAGWSIIEIDATHVYWMADNAHIQKWSKHDGTIEEIALDADYPPGVFASDGEYLYVAHGNCQAIARVSKQDHTLVRIDNSIAERSGGTTEVLVDANRIYCSSGGDGRVFVGDKLADHLDTLVQVDNVVARHSTGGIALTHDFLYFLRPRRSLGVRQHDLMRVPLTGGMPELLVELDESTTSRMVIDPNHARLFWKAVSNDGHVMRSYDIATGRVDSFPIDSPTGGLAVDDDYAYWITGDLGSTYIMRIPIR